MLSKSSPIQDFLNQLYEDYEQIKEGAVADYIPELAKVPSDLFGICLATPEGQVYEVGASQHPFTIQSISKAFVYGLALEDHGKETVMQRVGVEPTGEAFNSIILDDVNNRPYNPMVNAGAIVTTSLVKGNGYQERFSRILNLFERLTGRELSVDEAVYQSEKSTGHRNRAIAYLELNSGMINEPVDEHLDLYFRQCSILVTAKDLAVMAATLANNGINPLTQSQVISNEQVSSVLSVMASCGMYDFSGEWIYRVGLPAKSGVGGGIVAVLPGQLGIGVFSPRLDVQGNSVRGIRVCETLSSRFHLHIFDTHTLSQGFIRRQYTAAEVSSKMQRLRQEQEILQQQGQQIQVYELQGDLYFATMEQLMRKCQDLRDDAQYLILDGKKVGRYDSSALKLLVQLGNFLQQKEISLLLANFPSDLTNKMSEQTESCYQLFKTVDASLEFCENQLLSNVNLAESHSTIHEKRSLKEMDILQVFSPEESTILEKFVQEEQFQPQDIIIEEGLEGDSIYFLAAGQATVFLNISEGKKRLTTYIPGISFGELVLFESGKRTANIMADTEVICYVLTLENFERLLAESPAIYVKLLKAFGKSLADTLRRSTLEVRSLSS
ncbi:MAG: glutaminase A [Microcystaceae cyanobacterium]